jgi:hypothetical protein
MLAGMVSFGPEVADWLTDFTATPTFWARTRECRGKIFEEQGFAPNGGLLDLMLPVAAKDGRCCGMKTAFFKSKVRKADNATWCSNA